MRSSTIRLWGLCMLLPTLGWAQGQAPAQGQGSLNTITRVEVRGGSIEISGTRKPSFTTFTMTDPPRLVIDISEAVFSGVPDDLQVGNGVVTAIKTASYGSGEKSIARILVGFTKDVETDMQTEGGKLVVKVLGGGGEAVAGAQPLETGAPEQPGSTPPARTDTREQVASAQPPAAAGQPTGAPPGQAGTPSTAEDGSAPAASRRAEEDRLAQEKAARDAEARARADQEAERQKADADARAAARRAEEDRLAQQKEARAAAEAEKKAAAEAEKQRKADEANAAAEEKRRKQEEARTAALTEKERKAEQAKAAAEEKRRKQEEAKAAAEEERQRKADEVKEAAEEKRRQQAEAKAAVQTERQRKAEQAKAAAEEKRQQQAEAKAAAEEKRRQQAEAKAARNAGREQKVAVAEPQAPRAPTEPSQPVQVSAHRKTLTFVGFKQEPSNSRIFVRTNEAVRYSVSRAGDKALVLELENTRPGSPNTTRSLDTSYFDTAVALITPARIGKGVRIEIKLKESVPYEAHQDGNEVFIELQRPSRR